MYDSGKILKNWNMDEIRSLPYKFDYHKDKDLIDLYASRGHVRESMHIYNCFEDDLSIDFTSVKKCFSFLQNISLAVNLFKPGQYLPIHFDLYQKYKKHHRLSDDIKICRVIMMLENSSPGQILQIENNLIGNWEEGQWFSWCNQDRHAAYNFSTVDRYALQITGTIN